MKKILNITLLFAVVAFMASCSNKVEIYHPTNDNVSWESDIVQGLANADGAPIVVNIMRGVGKSSITVPFSFSSYTIETYDVTDEETGQVNTYERKVSNDLFTVNTSSVTFDANEFVKSVNVVYDYSTLEPGVDYFFELSFDDDIAGPGSFADVTGNIRMKLEYEDYKECAYDSYAYVNTETMTWAYGDGSYCDEFTNTPVVLQRAKGTTDYYKLTLYGTQELEFQAKGGEMVITKYDGYNDGITLNATYVIFTARVGADTWSLRYYPARVLVSAMLDDGTIETGAHFTFNGWVLLNGSYYPNSYNTFQYIDVL